MYRENKSYSFYFWQEAPFFRVLLPFMAGIICYYHSAVGGSLSVQAAMISAGILSVMSVLISWYRRRKTFVFPGGAGYWLLLQATWISIAFAFCCWHDVRKDPAWIGHHLKECQAFAAVVQEQPVERERTWKIPVMIRAGINSGHLSVVTGNAVVYQYKDSLGVPGLLRGDTILLPAQWIAIRNSGNPFEMNYQAFAARNNLYHQQFVSRHQWSVCGKAGPPVSFLVCAHDWGMYQLEKYIPDRVALGLLQAMLVGDEHNLDDDLRQSYADTGIVHVISISGSHVSALFLFVTWAFWWLRGNKYAWIRYFAAIPVVWLYVLIAGAPAPALRSALMFTLFAVGMIGRRGKYPLNTLIIAAFLILCWYPPWLFSIGFQLSFIAVLSLFLFYRPVCSWWVPANKWVYGIWQAIAASIAAEVLVFPLVIYYFHSFPVHFLLANLLAWLIMGIVMLLGMLLLAFARIPLIAEMLGKIITWILHYFDTFIGWLQRLSPQGARFMYFSGWELLWIYLVIGCLSVWFLRKQRSGLWLGLTGLCIWGGWFCIDEWQALHRKRLIVYNTRNGYAEVIRGKQHRVIYASGNSAPYPVNAVYAGWNCWKADVSNDPPGCIFWNKKKILFLQDTLSLKGAGFPVDVLVMCRPVKKLAFTAIQQVFRPRQIVFTGMQSRWYAACWADSCKAAGIDFHNVATDGAWIPAP